MPCPFLLRFCVGTGGSYTHRDYAFLPLAMFHHERAVDRLRPIKPGTALRSRNGLAVDNFSLSFALLDIPYLSTATPLQAPPPPRTRCSLLPPSPPAAPAGPHATANFTRGSRV
jgi:hypothetical protein